MIALSVFFIVNAWYNFNRQFLFPVKTEYMAIRDFIETRYRASHPVVFHFIRPSEDFFNRKYGITRSWDEFGVPSCFFDWVPLYFTRQLVFEETKDRELANKLVI